MFSPPHTGLFFDEQRITYVRKNYKREPLQSAWDYLLAADPEDMLQKLQLAGLRYRFNADLAAGQDVATTLASVEMPSEPSDLWILAHVFELVRDHANAPQTFLTKLQQAVNRSLSVDDVTDIVEQTDLMLLYAASSVVLEDETLLDRATAVYKHVVQEEIHPEGYIPKAVELFVEAVSLERQIKVVQALVLTAQIAEIVGVNLWQVEQRGVSIFTAASYPLYYYFYPEKWPWNEEKWKPSDGVELEPAQQIFREHAGFLEVLNLKYKRPLRAINMILEELRPVYDVYGGGLTTLTHAPAAKRGLFG